MKGFRTAPERAFREYIKNEKGTFDQFPIHFVEMSYFLSSNSPRIER